MKRLDLISGIFWVSFSLLAMVESYHLHLGSWQKPGSGFLPFLAACSLGFFSVFVLVQALFRRKESGEEEVWPNRNGWPKAAFILIALLGYALLLERTGFLLTTFLLLALLLKTIEPQSWKKSILFALSGSFASYLIFHTWLKVPLPVGGLIPSGF